MPIVYVAHPIDQAEPHPTLNGWLLQLVDLLRQEGVIAYWPSRPWTNLTGANSDTALLTIYEVNEAARRGSDVLVALLPAGMATYGVPVEIQKSLQERKPVIVVTDATGVQVRAWAEKATIVSDVSAVPRVLRTLPNVSDDSRKKTMFTQGPGINPPAYPGDAGWDLDVTVTTTVPARGYSDIPCGSPVALPPGYWGWLVGRSSTLRNRSLLVNAAVIDQGYRGPLFTGVQNLSAQPVTVNAGERIAQLIPIELASDDIRIFPADANTWAGMTPTKRGEAGFGSTGS